MAKRVARLKFNLEVIIGGISFRAVDFSETFALNRIPTARATLTIGRDAHTRLPAMIHAEYALTRGPKGLIAKSTEKALTQMSPVQVIFHPHGQWLPDDAGFPSDQGRWDQQGSQTIFEGYLAGCGYKKMQGKVSFVAHFTHWLSDLAFSSALSNQSHPGNPARFRWRAIYKPDTCHGQSGSYFVSDHLSHLIIKKGEIQKDLWKTWYQVFWSISEQDILRSGLTGNCEGLGGDNSQSKEALKRMETREAGGSGEVLGSGCDEGAGSPYFQPLSLEFGAMAHKVATSIARSSRRRANEGFFNTTIWDKLIELHGDFFFSVVPKIKTAQVVPFVPGLRSTWEKELEIDDITYLDTFSHIPRPVRAVGILAPAITTNSGVTDPVSLEHVGSCWAPTDKNEDTKGMVIFRNPPQWLAHVPAYAHDPERTLYGDGSSTTPAEEDGKVGDEDGITPAKANNLLRDYYTMFAHTYYVMEMLRGRVAVVQGKLRFDIAPGSTVMLRNRDPKFIEGDPLSQNLVASVVRVGIDMNAESGLAGTSFQLAHVRTETENQEDATSVEKHPLYNATFTGAPLLHEYKFEEGGAGSG